MTGLLAGFAFAPRRPGCLMISLATRKCFGSKLPQFAFAIPLARAIHYKILK
jgi:hypothetical protein